jgi:hypothetical protein
MTLRELTAWGKVNDKKAPLILPIGLMGIVCTAGAVILGG